jgi:glycosyltransferase involved in cell wall biosynthesis
MKKKILFCWSDVSGYMVACWKALDKIPSVDLHIIAFGKSDETSFDANVTHGLKIHRVPRFPEKKQVEVIVISLEPDIIVLCGWFIPAYKALAYNNNYRRRPKFILAMDTPWAGTSRQHVALWVLRPFIARMDAVLSSGERSYQYASRLKARKIFKFQYGVDTDFLGQAHTIRRSGQWPRRFLFVGRYAPEKGIAELMAAYDQYRSKVKDPWELHTCGQGPLKHLFETTGVVDHGFVQPESMVTNWASAGCLVLPSHFDPWPLIVVEACAAGLPVIVTHASGSQVETVKMYYNGLVINAADIGELTKALLWMHEHHEAELSEMGQRSLLQAQPYSAQLWAKKILALINDLT